MLKKLLFTALCSLSLFAMGGPSLVETTKLIKGEVNPLQQFVGTLKFDINSDVAAQNSGVVKSLKFKVGDKVKKGTVLIQIDADILNTQVTAARANAASAKKDHKRYLKLLETKSISVKQYDDIKLNFIRTSSLLKELEIQKKRKSIKAPFDGIVVEKKVNLGEWVQEGTSVLKLVNTSNAEITFNVPLMIINGLKKGDKYDINVGSEVLKATLQAAIPSGDKLTRTFPVRFTAKTNSKFLFDGQQAKVSLSKNAKKEALLLPRDSVINRFGQNVVFAINDKMLAVMIPVQVIGFDGNKVAISGQGLKVGMDIVVKGNERVFPNSPVKIINK